MNNTMITAHSGCELTEIDSMISIDLALECGADAIEVDVRMDPFKGLRISHNEVSLENYKLKMTLRDVFEKISDTNLSVNCDIKEQEALYRTLEEAEKFGFPPERLILSGCTSVEQLARDMSIAKRGTFFLNLEEVLKFVYIRRAIEFDIKNFFLLLNDPWKFLKEKALDLREEWVDDTVSCYQMLPFAAANLPKTLLNTNLVRALQAVGVPLSIWTVNEADLVRRCLEENVRNITTRQVRQAIRLRNEAARILEQ